MKWPLLHRYTKADHWNHLSSWCTWGNEIFLLPRECNWLFCLYRKCLNVHELLSMLTNKNISLRRREDTYKAGVRGVLLCVSAEYILDYIPCTTMEWFQKFIGRNSVRKLYISWTLIILVHLGFVPAYISSYVVRCVIWYHLCNLKNVKNTHRGVLLYLQLY